MTITKISEKSKLCFVLSLLHPMEYKIHLINVSCLHMYSFFGEVTCKTLKLDKLYSNLLIPITALQLRGYTDNIFLTIYVEGTH